MPALMRTDVPDSETPLRVLDITKFYAAVSGGVRTYLDQKMHDFADRDITHALVIPGESDSEYTVGRTRVHKLRGPLVPFSPHYRFLVSAGSVRRVIERERPHVIEVGSPFLVPHLVRRAIRRFPIPTVGFYHSDLVRAYAEPYVELRIASPLRVLARNSARAFIRSVYTKFDVTVAASPSVAVELRRLGVKDVRCVPLGVDLELFSPHADGGHALRDQLSIRDDVPIALYVGRFCSEKRLDVVLDAHRRLPSDIRPHLVLVGDGGQRGALCEEAARRTRLSVLPYVQDRNELARLYRGADCYIAPGPGETFGLAIAEAMASGLPVVAVDQGAAPDRVSGSTAGVLYRHGDGDSCADAMHALLARLSSELRAQARRHAETAFSWTRTFDKLEALYQELALRTRVPAA